VSSQARNACRAGSSARVPGSEPVALAGLRCARRGNASTTRPLARSSSHERRQHGDAEPGDRCLQHHLVVFEARPAAAVDAGDARALQPVGERVRPRRHLQQRRAPQVGGDSRRRSASVAGLQTTTTSSSISGRARAGPVVVAVVDRRVEVLGGEVERLQLAW
jgi:hypothetical protein